MKKLIKGSKAAKDFMAKIRAKRKINGVKDSKLLKKELAAKNIRLPHGYITAKKTRLSGIAALTYKGKKITTNRSGYYEFYSYIKRKYLKFNNLPAAKQMIDNEVISKQIKTKLAAKKLKLPHGYEAVKRSRKISGLHKDTNSHNVNLRIVSGINIHYSEKLTKLAKDLNKWNDVLKFLYEEKKTLSTEMKPVQNMYIKDVKNHIKTIKTEISLAKKHI